MPKFDLDDNDLVRKIQILTKAKSQSSNYNKLSTFTSELFRRYYSKGYNIARYYGLNRSDAEDAVQDAFIKTLRSISRFNPNKKFSSWFYKIVLNSVRDKYNHNKKHRHSDIEANEIISENNLDELHIKEAISGIINSLPEKYKSVVLLRVYGDLDFKSISEITGVSIRQLHNRLNSAYAVIREKVGEEDL